MFNVKLTRVQFIDTKEFLFDLKNDKELIDRKIVRITRQYEPADIPCVANIYVYSTAVVGKTLLELKQFVGKVSTISTENDSVVYLRTEAVINEIKNLCEIHGLNVRNGIFKSE